MQRLIILPILLIFLFLAGCSQLNKASDLISNPSTKEKYQRDFNISDELFQIWEDQVEMAMGDSIQIELPYLQAGHFKPRSFPALSFNISMKAGEILDITVEKDSVDLVFIELYRQEDDSIKRFKKIEDAGYKNNFLRTEITQEGTYKVLIQPEINANTPFTIKMKKSSVYEFPVAGGTNPNIQSFWGAARDGGRRSHEGVDIFAKRGTPVIAVTDGRITSSGEKGLGGKQVWLRDPERGQSLYYAHLDSIAPLGNTHVKTGDTIGFVGNTGNARTTPPHLHFGIYKGYRGAVDPLPHIYQFDEPDFKAPEEIPESLYLVTKATANLRNEPTTKNSEIIGNLNAKDTLQLLGKSKEWFHIRTAANKAAFIHETLVSPL